MRSQITEWQAGDGAALLRGLGAYASAEVIVRIVRLGTVVAIARKLSPEMMGAAALALSLFELVRVLAGAGIGQRIVAASDKSLAATCNTAHRLFWAWCCCIALLQLAVAGVLAFSHPDSALMLALLSGVYLMMPGGLVQVFLMMREGRLGETARIGAAQTLCDHLLTMVLVLAWPDQATIAFAIVLPKLLTTPIWLLAVRRARPWQAETAAGTMPVNGFIRFGAGVLVTEVAGAARSQLDKIIISAFLGVKALGLYYFAFNAGLGITNSFVSAFATVLFPWLCRAVGADRGARYRRGLVTGLCLFLPVTLAQVSLASAYVPLVFGDKWAAAAPLVALLGLGALPMVAAAATTAWLRAEGRSGLDGMVSTIASVAALSGLAIGAGVSIETAAAAYVAGLSLVLIPFSIFILVRSAATPAANRMEAMA